MALPALPDKLKSRKLWIALMGSLLPIASSVLSAEVAPEKALELAAGVFVAYLLGQAGVDAMGARRD